MRDDPFESPKLLMARAQENLLDFRQREKAFFDRKPYARIIDIDPNSGHEVHKLRITAKVPGGLSAVVADALNNIRHALDQSVVASARMTNADANVKSIYFPICHNGGDLDSAINAKCRGVHPEVVSYIRELKPYRGGHLTIWGLSKLAGTNKHQLLTPVAAVANEAVTVIGFNPARANDFMPTPSWDGTKNELTLFRKAI